MSRLGLLVAALMLFVVAAPVARAGVIPPMWRVRLGFLTIVGTFVARYNVQTADSVLRGRHEGTKKP